MRVEEPDKIRFSMTITLTLDEWMTLQRNLGKTWHEPMCAVSIAINAAITAANERFMPGPPERV